MKALTVGQWRIGSPKGANPRTRQLQVGKESHVPDSANAKPEALNWIRVRHAFFERLGGQTHAQRSRRGRCMQRIDFLFLGFRRPVAFLLRTVDSVAKHVGTEVPLNVNDTTAMTL